MKYLFVIFLISLKSFSADYESNLIQKADAESAAFEAGWLKLLHYQRGIFGSYKSLNDSPLFFISPNGKTDPRAELQADLSAFLSKDFTDPTPVLNEGQSPQHPQCRFQGRWIYLKRRLKIDSSKIFNANCERYEAFQSRIKAEAVSIVFSSYYLNNPASSFGHTFLRFKKKSGKVSDRIDRSSELLDYGVSFAANVNTTNAFLYGLYGLFGVFPGTFTSLPYYYKVREYNDAESRDLWEYELDLKPEELVLLVAHLWEVGPTYFDYYYLTENCSTHMLTQIEAAAPRLDLFNKLGPIVVPIDAIRVAAKVPGLIRSVDFRPSIRKQFYTRVAGLSPDEVDLAELSMKSESPGVIVQSELAPDRKAATLDAAIDGFDLVNFKDVINDKSDASKLKHQYLLARSRILVKTPELKIDIDPSEIPDTGHKTWRVGIGATRQNQGRSSLGFESRVALHDLLDSTRGYPETAQIEFFNLKLEYLLKQSQFRLAKFEAIRVLSLNPWDRFFKQMSWGVRLGVDTTSDERCDSCKEFVTRVSGGPSFSFVKNKILFYTFGSIAPRYGSSLKKTKWNLSLGPEFGIVLSPTQRFKILTAANWDYLPFGDIGSVYDLKTELRWSIFDNLALSARGEKLQKSAQFTGMIYYYF